MAGTRLTVEQVLALAPDQSSARAARGLANPRPWSELGSTDTLVWGRCQGSGKDPYQVTVDLTGPAFTCTCPSRKFPCKHGVALLLLWAQGEGSVAHVEQAAGFASDWAGRRAAARPARDEPVDPEAQARRTAERVATMSAGIEDFGQWLEDLVRQGLAVARRQPFSFWDGAAARLVDAQLPALADRVRAAGGWVHARPDWAEHLLAEVGRWFLAVRAWRKRDELDDDLAADLRVVLGWGRRADEVVAGERIHDRWLVVGRRLGDDGRIVSQRTWLTGERTGETALLLDFAAAGNALPVAQVVGTVVEGDLALYPGSRPRRAILAGHHDLAGSGSEVPGATTIDDNLDRAATILASNPWAERFPFALREVVAMVDGDGGAIVDGSGRRLPLAPDADPWLLLALTGGEPADLFAEWEDEHVHPVSVAIDGALVGL